MRTVYSRGNGTAELAGIIDPDAVRVAGSVTEAAVAQRAELLVARRVSAAKELLPVLIPRDLDVPAIGRIVAAVGGGPHSELAATVTTALSEGLGVPARMVCAYPDPGGKADAEATIERIGDLVPDLAADVIEGHRVHDLIEDGGDGALLVLGAPGGSFLQRQFFGAGARLIAHAPVGAVVVRDVPMRVFQRMEEPEWVGRQMPASAAATVHSIDPVPVVDQGVVVGVVAQTDLATAGEAPVEAIMRPPVTVEAVDLLLEARDAIDAIDGGAVPVVHREQLVGVLSRAPVGS